VKTASADALDAVKGKTGRICPLVCDNGFRADGDLCVKIACRAGYRINDDNECERVLEKKPVAKREEPKQSRERVDRKTTDAAPAKPQAAGQVLCDTGGCRPLRKGCRVGFKNFGAGAAGSQVEICN
jgi:hypothetical protein